MTLLPTSGEAAGVTQPMPASHRTFPGVLQNNIFRSDPVTNSDKTGQFFYLSLQSTWPTQTFYCDDLWRSTNGGQTWTEQSPDRSAGGDKAVVHD